MRVEVKPVDKDDDDDASDTKADSESDEATEEAAEKSEDSEEAKEPVFEDKMVPHVDTLTPKEELLRVRQLSKDAKFAAKARIRALEKRDNDKLKTDEAKNDFESLIYEFRGWLNDEDHHIYEETDEIENLI